jgi:uncharacterized phage protein (predicted DNA packaging)
MDISMVKKYLRIDEDEDDNVLQIMMQAAESYILDAVGVFNESDFKAQLLFLAIVQDFYENRVLTVKESDKQRMSHVFGSIIMQLQCRTYGGESGG